MQMRPIELRGDAVKVKPTVFACSGSANVGQLTNSCALRLEQDGSAVFACTASLGCHDPDMIRIGHNSPKVLALDGCSKACCSKTLEHAGVKVDHKLTMTDLGIEKTHGILCSEQEKKAAIEAVNGLIKG